MLKILFYRQAIQCFSPKILNRKEYWRMEQWMLRKLNHECANKLVKVPAFLSVFICVNLWTKRESVSFQYSSREDSSPTRYTTPATLQDVPDPGPEKTHVPHRDIYAFQPEHYVRSRPCNR